MTYDAREASVAGGSPYYLYEFNTNGKAFRFTDHPANLEWNGQTWKAFPITHTEVKQSGEISKNSIKVEFPIQGEFAGLFLGWSPDHVVSFTLRRGHMGESTTLVYWKGRVTSHVLKDQLLELKCESIFTSMRRSGVRARYQKNCRHALYGRGCNVDKDAFAVPGLLAAVSGLTLAVPEAASKPDNWFLGGAVEFPDGSFRMIKAHTGSSITISRASRYVNDNIASLGYGLSYGQAYGGMRVVLYPGCDRTIATCKNKFNNLDNQGGFRWIPSKNPMGGSSII